MATSPIVGVPGEDPNDVDLSEPDLNLPPTGEEEQEAAEASALEDELMAAFERKAQGPTAASASMADDNTDDGSVDDTAEGNDVAPVEATGEATPPGQQQDDDGQADDTSTAPASGPDLGQEPPTPPEAIDVYGWQVNAQEAAQARAVYEWQQQLAPPQIEAIDALLSGEYVLVPRAEANKPPATPPVTAPVPGDSDDDYIDPAIAQRLGTFEERLAQVADTQEQALAAQRAQQQAEFAAKIEADINTGIQTFATAYSITEAEANNLAQKVVQAQILPGFAKQYAGKPAEAMKAALEAVAWSDESFRSTQIQRQTEARIEAERKAAQATREKGRKQGSLMGSGGSVPRQEPPATKQDRTNAMVAEIAAARGT